MFSLRVSEYAMDGVNLNKSNMMNLKKCLRTKNCFELYFFFALVNYIFTDLYYLQLFRATCELQSNERYFNRVFISVSQNDSFCENAIPKKILFRVLSVDCLVFFSMEIQILDL